MEAIKYLIASGHYKTFKELFATLERKTLAEKTNISYQRLLRLIKRPYLMTIFEAEQIARALSIPFADLHAIVENQILLMEAAGIPTRFKKPMK